MIGAGKPIASPADEVNGILTPQSLFFLIALVEEVELGGAQEGARLGQLSVALCRCIGRHVIHHLATLDMYGRLYVPMYAGVDRCVRSNSRVPNLQSLVGHKACAQLSIMLKTTTAK